ncbi:MAG: aspartate carbamoyltransferase catalytic subunit [Planctomycetota bacterium]|nr:MAG: aspartate carbamoyltransferase catalytic subunit [Planctomycetota bacterium]
MTPDQVGDEPRHILDLRTTPVDRLRALLAQTRRIETDAAGELAGVLAGRFVANLFFEPSTRTRLSFTAAARRLGAEVLDLMGEGSSVSKGETLADTVRTVEAIGAEVIVVRHSASGSAAVAARAAAAAVVINAGDGAHEHPTQGLLDTYVIAEALGRLDGFDLTGLRLGVVGDVAHSRVARSDLVVWRALGAETVAIGPAGLAPASLEALGCAVEADLDEALPTLDAVQMLRVQRERGADTGALREYTDRYRLDEARLGTMRSTAVVLHPGPMNRGVEIESTVADSPRCLAERQVRAGVPVRMAAMLDAAAVNRL